MRMSCNGCRVLRKGCNDNCSIRPCLEWIETPNSQANATLFLAKFYGRAGLINLINAGPEHRRPAIFRSLLYEACGRNVNPIYGSVGLLWSDNWSLCQNAVDAVLNGAPITQIGSEAAEGDSGPVPRDDNSGGSDKIHQVWNRCRFKRTAAKLKTSRSTSHESALSHLSEAELNVESESLEAEGLAAGKDTELHGAAPESGPKPNDAGDEIELELTLGFEPVSRSQNVNDKRNKTGSSLQFVR